MRLTDLKDVVRQLKTSFQLEAGPKLSRPSSMLFRRWQKNARRVGLGSSSRRGRRRKKDRLPPLELFQPSEPRQINVLFDLVRLEPECVSHYLTHHVFPSTMHHQRVKICSSGQELGSRILFGRRLGFSGTWCSSVVFELVFENFNHIPQISLYHSRVYFNQKNNTRTPTLEHRYTLESTPCTSSSLSLRAG